MMKFTYSDAYDLCMCMHAMGVGGNDTHTWCWQTPLRLFHVPLPQPITILKHKCGSKISNMGETMGLPTESYFCASLPGQFFSTGHLGMGVSWVSQWWALTVGHVFRAQGSLYVSGMFVRFHSHYQLVMEGRWSRGLDAYIRIHDALCLVTVCRTLTRGLGFL